MISHMVYSDRVTIGEVTRYSWLGAGWVWSGIKVEEGRDKENPAFPVACILEPYFSSSECHMALESPDLKVHSQGGHRYHPWRIIEQKDNDSTPRKEEYSALSKEVRNLICLEKVEDQSRFQPVSYTGYTRREREKSNSLKYKFRNERFCDFLDDIDCY